MNSPHNRRILIVDDNPEIHLDFKKILQPKARVSDALAEAEADIFGDVNTEAPAEQFELDSAVQGKQALELVQRAVAEGRPYAMAFMDVRMPPGWDGVETTLKVWEADPRIQIVLCTAYSDYSWDEVRDKLGRSERLIILKKPFDNIEALQLASALTERWHQQFAEKQERAELEKRVDCRTSELVRANETLRAEIAERRQAEAELTARLTLAPATKGN